jgi:hypothetical protein
LASFEISAGAALFAYRISSVRDTFVGALGGESCCAAMAAGTRSDAIVHARIEAFTVVVIGE